MTINIKSESVLQLGIDVGSTTVKAVVVDKNNNILWKDYKRHNAKQPECVRDFLVTIEKKFPCYKLSIFITGSGGRAVATHINAKYIQEVNAVTYAVETRYPDTGSVIELGGQDAKVIIWKGEDEREKTTLTFMNDKCAGGTGATIDKILSKIGLPLKKACTVSVKGKTVHHIAAKCGVFAETDVVGLLKAGVDKEEIFISLCNAVVKQNLEVLVRGNVLRTNVLLLGGPHTYINAFKEIWREQLPQTWKIHNYNPNISSLEDAIFVPPEAQYFAAIGAVLFGKKTEELHGDINKEGFRNSHFYPGINALETYLHSGRSKQLASSGAIRNGLISSQEELDLFAKKYTIPQFTQPQFEKGICLPVYIGIDGGSTSTKLVLLDKTKNLIYKDYTLSKGNPILDLREMFAKIQKWTKSNELALEVLGTSVTGYASEILSVAFGLDLTVVETVAHMKATVAYYGDIDIICDIGGQDIKVLFMKYGRVVDFKLNTQCSAGNGYFLQSMAEQFNIPIEEYARHAFKAEKAPAFNYGCAVFMEQDKVNFQQLGWTKDEIMAGLALVLPLNIWNYVVQESNMARFGNRIVLQGGTQKNLAAVKSQVDYINSKVDNAQIHVHKHADICGAIGAAIEILDQGNIKKSSFIGIKNATNISFKSKNNRTTRCTFCHNKCPRTFIDITISAKQKTRYISGYGCEKGMSDSIDNLRDMEGKKQSIKKKCPNLVHEACVQVFKDYPIEPMPQPNTLIKRSSYYPNNSFKQKEYTKNTPFETSSENAKLARQKMVVGIPKLLNMFYYTPFFSTYFRALGIKKVIYSDYTSTKLWNEGNKWGAIDPCFPAKVAPAHIFNLIKKNECTHVCFPIITHLQSSVDNTLGNNACVIQMGTPEVIHAVFTRERDFFKEHGLEFWKPLIAMDKPMEINGLLYEYFKDRLNITEDENAWAVYQGQKALKMYISNLQEQGIAVINQLIDDDKIGILLVGHPYHHDPGLNHGILDTFQLRGFPVLCIESIPTTKEFLEPLFGSKEYNQSISSDMDISDIWQKNFNRNTNLKLWSAKIAARHPNLAVIDLSSFKCGHDAPTYSYIDNILDASETPHFLFHDIDQNKPGATFNIRIQTIEYFLKKEEERLLRKVKK